MHELQLDQGETGVLTATVKPVGTPVSWTSSNENVAIVNNGTVSGVGPGTAVVTAEITVGDVTVSDTCSVTVSEWELVRDLTNAEVWNNPELWIQQDFQDETRQTHIKYENGKLALVHGSGSSTTLYADLRPAIGDFHYEEDYEYSIDFVFENAETPNNSFELTVQKNSTNNTLNPPDAADVFTASGPYIEYSVPVVYTADNARLTTIQIRKAETPEDGSCYLTIRIRRRLTV